MTGQWDFSKNQAIIALDNVLQASASAHPQNGPATAETGWLPKHIPTNTPVKYYPGEPAAPRTFAPPKECSSLKWAALQAKSASNSQRVSNMHKAVPQEQCPLQNVEANASSKPSPEAAAVCVLKPSNRGVVAPMLHMQLERGRNMAVLLMEKKLAQLNQELLKSREIRAKHAQQLEELDAMYKDKLRAAEGAIKSKLKAAQLRLARQRIEQHQHQLMMQCIASWLQHAHRQQHRQKVIWQLQQRRLGRCWQSWTSVVAEKRRAMSMHQDQAAVLLAWRTQHVALHVAAQQAAARLQQRQLRHMVVSWHMCTAQVQEQLAWASRWYRRRVLGKRFSRWFGMCAARHAKAADMVARNQGRLLLKAMQEWLQATQHNKGRALAEQQAAAGPAGDTPDLTAQAEAEANTAVLQHAFRWWQLFITEQAQHSYLQHVHQQSVLRQTLLLWAQLPAASARLAAAAAAFSAIGVQLQKHWGLHAFTVNIIEAKARQQLQLGQAARCLRHWKVVAAVQGRDKRVLIACVAASRQHQVQRCFVSWWQQAARAARHAADRQVRKLEDVMYRQQSELECAKAQEVAAAEQLKMVVVHNQQLQQQTVAACAGALTEMQFSPALCHQSLPFNPGAAVLAPRARHATLRLEAMQPAGTTAAAASQEASAACSAMSGCLLVFGGVSGTSWLADLTALVLEQGDAGDVQLAALPVPVVNDATGNQTDTISSNINSAGGQELNSSLPATAQQQVPFPVRDFAACVCGHNQFVVSGGFDGQLDAFRLQLCELQRPSALPMAIDHPSVPGRAGGSACNDDSSSNFARNNREGVIKGGKCRPSSSSSYVSWIAGWHQSWQMLQPRNPAPRGRCHHTISYYPQGRSLVVFGGYADREGCLNDVWLFHQDHMEWWQPDVTGGSVPCCRRSHVSAVLGHQLFIHGGLDSCGQHLDDLWCLDMTSWQWEQVNTQATCFKGACPSARRAHSLEVIGGRYLLLHGGYSGTHQLLHDTWVYDKLHRRWTVVDVQAPAAELPVPRALHTLTQVGNSFILLGGQGPLGPLGSVTMLECPAVRRGVQLQHQLLQSQAQQVHWQQCCVRLQADVSCSRAELKESRRQLQVFEQNTGQLAAQHTAAIQQCNALQANLEEALQAAAAAQQRAYQADVTAAALERRLLRARQGGSKAVATAEGLVKQLQAAEGNTHHLHQQLRQAQQQLQQQQLLLAERNAEVAVLKSQLADCQTRATLAAAASDSVQLDFKTALSRSNQLYEQELQHMQDLLQAAKQKELAALQAKAPATTVTPPAEAAPTTAAAQQAAVQEAAACGMGPGVPACQQQQQQQVQEVNQQTAPCSDADGKQLVLHCHTCQACGMKCHSRSADDSYGYLAEHVWPPKRAAASGVTTVGCGGAGEQLLCMSADQVAQLSSRQGRAQAQVEMLQQQMKAQQGELSKFKHQLRLEQQAAAVAQEARASAVTQLHAMEQQYQQQLNEHEKQLKEYKWRLWEAELDAATAAKADGSKNSNWACQLSATGPAMIGAENRVQHKILLHTQHPDVAPVVGSAAASDSEPLNGLSSLQGGQIPAGTASTDAQFTVQLVSAEPAGQLEMLPEVLKLFELHRGLMALNAGV